jgi:aryl-alcohol dehydrogenase-like predicted oxidoreductase
MSLSGMYGPADDEESLKVLKQAVDIGCTFWDSAVIYGFGHNEKLLGRFFKENPGSREKVFLASKCAYDVSRLLNASS